MEVGSGVHSDWKTHVTPNEPLKVIKSRSYYKNVEPQSVTRSTS